MNRQQLNLEACANEPIHVPGSIQPHGLLLVVDQATDEIMQAAGDGESLLGLSGALLGRSVEEVLGASLSELAQRTETGLIGESAYLGTVSPATAGGPLSVLAHQVEGGAVVEVVPAWPHASAAETLARIRFVTERIGSAPDVLEACSVAAAEVRRLTGYDRVMIYRFLPDGAGSVIAEDKDPHLAAFLNHRYPESDIPRQARELYRRSTIRVIADVNYTPAPLLPPLSPLTDRPLDMSYCALRSVSPVHIRYLQNMNVGASMSISLLSRGELWGLIACHNTTARNVAYETQEICRHIGQVLSQLIRLREEAEHDRVAHELSAARDAIMATLSSASDPAGSLAQLCSRLGTIARSDGVAVVAGASVQAAGHAPREAHIRQLAAWLEPQLWSTDFFVTDRLSEAFPDAAAYAGEASGLLATRVPGADGVIVMWFRVEQLEEIMWAGNPHKPVDPGAGLGQLNPRRSFATWIKTVKGRSRPWTRPEVESVQAFGPRAAVFLQQQKITELNALLGEANARLARLASTDGLTGLANRRAFDGRLHEEWARARRIAKSVGLVIVDLDYFKQYNDRLGHPAGDDCLKRIAEVLQEGRRAADCAARIGGEEFSVLLPDTDVNGALAVAESIRSGIQDLHIEHPGSPFGYMTASVGVACAPADGAGTAHDLMKAADSALYKAKVLGRNRVVAY